MMELCCLIYFALQKHKVNTVNAKINAIYYKHLKQANWSLPNYKWVEPLASKSLGRVESPSKGVQAEEAALFQRIILTWVKNRSGQKVLCPEILLKNPWMRFSVHSTILGNSERKK